ncbi:MAG: HAD-IB family phosphatase [Gammaproteobacteria bacterium]
MAGPPFSTVFFDCDSTLCALEGIDALAGRAGVAEQLAPLTKAAMDGVIPLERVYRHRLDVVRPDSASMAWLGQYYLKTLVDGAREVVRVLHALEKRVYIVSGGIRQAVLHVAAELEIPQERVHAVDLFFNEQGAFCGYDERSALVRADGKATVCRQLLADGEAAALVGDGMVDIAAQSAGVFIIGFGGVVHRPRVAERAAIYIDEPSLRPVLPFLLTREERDRAKLQQAGNSEESG